jgi:hypothetical protein
VAAANKLGSEFRVGQSGEIFRTVMNYHSNLKDVPETPVSSITSSVGEPCNGGRDRIRPISLTIAGYNIPSGKRMR